MNDDNYSNYDLYDGDCTGQSPDDDQSLVVPRRGLEPDTGPDDDPMTVQRRGSPSDTDSFVSEEDMDEYPEAAFFNVGTIDEVIEKAKTLKDGE